MKPEDIRILEKYSSVYPNLNSKEFTKEWASKFEIVSILKNSVQDSFYHQKIEAMFMSPFTPYESMLFAHDVGTGKTCLVSLLVENFKKASFGKFKPAIVLVPNDVLVDKYYFEIEKICTQNEYTQEKADELKKSENLVSTEFAKRNRMHQLIRTVYEIDTYTKFIQKYSDRISSLDNRNIFIDESHKLRPQSGKKDDMYSKIWKILTKTKNTRKYLLSATPMTDSAAEFASQMNLILPLSDQLPTGSQFFSKYFSSGKLQNTSDLIDKVKFRISYLRGLSSNTRRIYEGITEPFTDHTKVYPCVLSELQAKAVQEATKLKVVQKKGLIEKEQTEGGVAHKVTISASEFCFPILENGKLVRLDPHGFDNNVDLKMQKYVYKKNSDLFLYFLNTDTLFERIRKLRVLSAKWAKIVSDIFEFPDQKIFIFNKSVTSGGGMVNFMLILRTFFSSFPDNTPGCEFVTSFPRNPKPHRFTVVSSNPATLHRDSEISKFISSVNDPKNMYGEYVQIILAGEKIEVGVNLLDFRRFYDTQPHWNFASADQGMGRIFRPNSHLNFPPEKNFVILFRMMSVFPESLKNPKKSTKSVTKKHQMFQTVENESQGYPANESYLTQGYTEGMDPSVYQIAEEKEKDIVQIRRLMKKVSWDCPILYSVNVRNTDTPESRECDYTQCNFTCHNFPQKYISKESDVWKYQLDRFKENNLTYSIYYNSQIINKILPEFYKLWKRKSFWSFEEISDVLQINFYELWNLVFYLNLNFISVRDAFGFESKLEILPNGIQLKTNTNFVNIKTSLLNCVETDSYLECLDYLSQFLTPEKISGLSKVNVFTSILLGEKALEIYLAGVNEKQKEVCSVLIENIRIRKINSYEYVHPMYNIEFSERSDYKVNIQPNGNTRVYNLKMGGWYTPYTSINTEGERSLLSSYEKAKPLFSTPNVSEKAQEKKSELDIAKESSPWGVVGFTDTNEKFKIWVRDERGDKRKNKGKVCTTYSKEEFAKIMIRIEFYSEFEETNVNPESVVIENPELDFSGLSEKQIRQTKTMIDYLFPRKTTKPTVCKKLQEYLEAHGAYVNLNET